jgi:mannose-6-phosphate isomerase-like protein (cupin superfamily)
MGKYPYTVDNGLGEQLTFTGRRQGPTGLRAQAVGVAQPNAGPPMHVHYFQDEAVRVVSGRLGHQVLGQEPQYAGPGDLVVWPAGTPHKWWNAGVGELQTTGWCEPADNVEFFLRALFASTKASGTGRPAMFDAAFLMTRYRAEYAMLEMPAVVRRVVMPMIYALGLLLGKYDKFKDAPPARTRDSRVASPRALAHGSVQ